MSAELPRDPEAVLAASVQDRGGRLEVWSLCAHAVLAAAEVALQGVHESRPERHAHVAQL